LIKISSENLRVVYYKITKILGIRAHSGAYSRKVSGWASRRVIVQDLESRLSFFSFVYEWLLHTFKSDHLRDVLFERYNNKSQNFIFRFYLGLPLLLGLGFHSFCLKSLNSLKLIIWFLPQRATLFHILSYMQKRVGTCIS